MKKALLLLQLSLCSYLLQAQNHEFSIKELVSLTNISINKFDNYAIKRGYKPHPDMTVTEFGNAFSKLTRESRIEKLLERYDKSDTSAVFYMTNSANEFADLKSELERAGFAHEETESKKNPFPSLYQRGDVAVRPAIKQDGDKTVYAFTVERKSLPKASDIKFVEDLLLLTSHENIAAVFGDETVKKDVFYFSEDEITKCSVLFPNSNRQVIFIWKDQVNRKDIDFILIGGHVRSQGSKNFDSQINMNMWYSRQGVKLGMRLQDIEELNGQPFLFHGWESEQPGVISPKNAGLLNFKKIGVQFNCFNCREDEYYAKNGELISSDKIAKENTRVYVSTLIILP